MKARRAVLLVGASVCLSLVSLRGLAEPALTAPEQAPEPELARQQTEQQDPEYSELEQYTINRELGLLRRAGQPARVEASPEGKRIESIRVVPLEVFDEQDPVPLVMNSLHVTTRARIVRRELLVHVGDQYRTDLVTESERKLRAARQLSLVLVVPLAGSTPDQVRLLVITRDVWSLRLNWGARFQAGKLEQLLLQPSEENLFGTHRTVSGLFSLQLDRYVAGAAYINPKVGGSRIQSTALANVIINRETGEGEGSYGGFSYGQPLFSTEATWAWGVTLLWRREIVRRFVGGELAQFDSAFGQLPYVYSSDKLAGEYALTRSFGERNKLDLSLGAEATRRAFALPDVGRVDPRAAAEFLEREVPQADTRVSPFVGVQAYSTRYLRTLNLETLSLQEDAQLGHAALLKIYPASTGVGSSRTLLGVHSSLGYTFQLGDGLLRTIGTSRIEMSAPGESDAEFEGSLRIASPRFGVGRLVYDGVVVNRYLDYLNERFALGGNSRPRGYPSFAFIGKDRVESSVEFRSTPVQFLGAALGGVLFYDVGDAFNGFEHFEANQALGLGVRGLLPMFDRIVFRLDWGFPVASRHYATLPGNFLLTFRQAFLPAQVTPRSVTAGLANAE